MRWIFESVAAFQWAVGIYEFMLAPSLRCMLVAVLGLVGGVWLGARPRILAAPAAARPSLLASLRLRGGEGRRMEGWGREKQPRPGAGSTIEEVVNERARFELRRAESEQVRTLRKRREQWERRVRPATSAAGGEDDGMGDSDELSSEGDISSDRPDAYKKPQEPVETDFKETGLPDWLDPIYDYAEPSEYMRAGMCGDGDSNEGFNEDIANVTQDPHTGKFHVKYNRIPGLLHHHDHLKDLTVSEWEEIDRIWNFQVCVGMSIVPGGGGRGGGIAYAEACMRPCMHD